MKQAVKTRYHFLRQNVKSRVLKFNDCPNEVMLADWPMQLSEVNFATSILIRNIQLGQRRSIKDQVSATRLVLKQRMQVEGMQVEGNQFMRWPRFL